MSSSGPDPFEDVFVLEEKFYSEGFNQGTEDGTRAGRIEGRALGMEKGFEKFLESGRLAGKSIVWANRLTKVAKGTVSAPTAEESSSERSCTLPALSKNPRLERNVSMIYGLVEPGTLSTANTDSAVQDFDDRVKRAEGKAKVVERLMGGNRDGYKTPRNDGQPL